MMKSNARQDVSLSIVAGKNNEQKAKGHEKKKTNGGKGSDPPEDEHKEREEPSSSSSSSPQRIKGKCDICEKKDKGTASPLNLQKCCMCGVLVHETCYGLVLTNKKLKQWKCAACAAIGTEIVISHKGEKRQTMVQEKRPTECVLCSVDSGIHAMHPLYDDGGSNGRHMVLPPRRKGNLDRRLAWVHSLCAFSIGSAEGTKGCVYSCDKDGYYEGADDEDSDEEAELQDDDESVISSTSEEIENRAGKKRSKNKNGGSEKEPNSKHNESDESDSEDLVTSSHHHFAIAGMENGRHTVWSRIIYELRNDCKCTFCGLSDKNSLRIPVQCVAGDDNEFHQFKNRHPSLGPGEYCHQAMHIGCARWGLDSKGDHPSDQRVYCHFGSIHGGPYAEPVVCAYCPLHARELGKDKDKKGESRQNSQLAKAGTGRNMVEHNKRRSNEKMPPVGAVRRQSIENVVSGVAKKRKSDDDVSRVTKRRSSEEAAPPTHLKRRRSIEEAVPPSHLKRRRSNEEVVPPTRLERRRSEEAVPSSHPKGRKSSDSKQHSARAAMLSDDSVPRYLRDDPNRIHPPKDRIASMPSDDRVPKYLRGSSNKVHPKKDLTQDQLKEASNHLLKQLGSANGQEDLQREIQVSCKAEWKKRLNLPKEEFRNFWRRVREIVIDNEENEGPEYTEGSVNANSRVEEQKAAKGGDHQESHASAHLDVSKPSRKSHPNPWSRLWLPSRKLQDFDFGDWDTYDIIGEEL